MPRRTPAPRSRRAFLGEFGTGTFALAVFTPLATACGSAESAESTTPITEADTTMSTSSTAEPTPTTGDADNETTTTTPREVPNDLRWGRANLGFVSAYVLARGNSAAIVDTGTAGSAEAIGQTLASLGLTYDDVGHVILTHKHADHAGSTGEVLELAPMATVYAGEADLADLDDFGIDGLVGGEDVFGFEMVATPGHTAGHMAVIDHKAGLLVAGDAIFTSNGGATEGPQQFFDDVPESRESIKRLAQLSFNTLLVGHGDPLEGNADTAVADLAASFG